MLVVVDGDVGQGRVEFEMLPYQIALSRSNANNIPDLKWARLSRPRINSLRVLVRACCVVIHRQRPTTMKTTTTTLFL